MSATGSADLKQYPFQSTFIGHDLDVNDCLVACLDAFPTPVDNGFAFRVGLALLCGYSVLLAARSAEVLAQAKAAVAVIADVLELRTTPRPPTLH